MRARISVGGVVLHAELSDTATAEALYAALPFKTGFSEWGDEFYFEVPVEMELDSTATLDVAAGDIGYWPPGRAVALFFGPTPMSTGDEPVPASEVNIIGRILGDAGELRRASGADSIEIVKA